MLVKNWMSKTVVTIDKDESMQDAINSLKKNNIRTLPVTEKGKLVGIVTDRDLKRASASDATSLDIYELFYLMSKIKVKHLMTLNPVTVPLDYTIEETAELLLTKRISGAPVVNHDGELVGIITRSDIFRALISLTGLSQRGLQFAFQVEDRPGSIKEVADIIRKYNGRMVSILTTYDRTPMGYRTVYLRAFNVDRDQVQNLKKEIQANAILLYVVDHKHNLREFFS